MSMSSVIQLQQYRETHEEEGPRTCECGSVWFELVVHQGGEMLPGAVMLNAEGKVTGWMGELVCRECGIVSTGPMGH